MSASITITVPSESSFGNEAFRPAPDLERLASRFMAEYPEKFAHIGNIRLAVLWKAKGGKSRGQLRLGQCAKSSGLAKYWGENDFTIWLAADHLRGDTQERIASVLFHELLHIGEDDDTGEVILVGHDLEFFFSEVQERGLWRSELEQAAEVFRQLPLNFEPAAD